MKYICWVVVIVITDAIKKPFRNNRGRQADLLLNWSLFASFREEVLTFTFAGPETLIQPRVRLTNIQEVDT